MRHRRQHAALFCFWELTSLTSFLLVGHSHESDTSRRAARQALLCLFIGAFTKSAQRPFHFWLPGAMAAPTPVSAYLHPATMMKLGIDLLARLDPAFGRWLMWEVTLVPPASTTPRTTSTVLGTWRQGAPPGRSSVRRKPHHRHAIRGSRWATAEGGAAVRGWESPAPSAQPCTPHPWAARCPRASVGRR